MSHRGIIDRKSLKEYKKLVNQDQNTLILERFKELEKLVLRTTEELEPKPFENQPSNDSVSAKGPDRLDIFHFCLKHYSIGYFEKKNNIYFKHQVEFNRDSDKLKLDGLRQDDDLELDIIIHFEFITKPYQDAPGYSSELEKKIELYELLTGRLAKGILLIITDNKNIYDRQEYYLEMIINSVENKKIELVVYSCDQIGFDRDSIHNQPKESNLKK
nr:hypothetical protein [uncultured Lacinutrix sp.]